jgi:hypothetical protein
VWRPCRAWHDVFGVKTGIQPQSNRWCWFLWQDSEVKQDQPDLTTHVSYGTSKIVPVVLKSTHNQGDQIGRIFTCWAIAFFGTFFWKLQKPHKNVWATFFYRKRQTLILTKMGWATHLSRDFFTTCSLWSNYSWFEKLDVNRWQQRRKWIRATSAWKVR